MCRLTQHNTPTDGKLFFNNFFHANINIHLGYYFIQYVTKKNNSKVNVQQNKENIKKVSVYNVTRTLAINISLNTLDLSFYTRTGLMKH